MHRLFDLVLGTFGLIVFSPLLLIAALGILVADGLPILYVARRAGVGFRPVKVHKLRTMRIGSDAGSRITAGGDTRVFYWGKLLRRLKVDEMPQLYDVVVGRLAIVGPRPEDFNLAQMIFKGHPAYEEMLRIRPGLISPGTLFYHAHLEDLLPQDETERRYEDWELPVKSAYDLVYIRHRSLVYDLKLVIRAVVLLGSKFVGIDRNWVFPEKDEAISIARSEFGVDMTENR
jgi:lipopolysaccharide/colanic/teichoic acid biosynthesis glycosyltransferase